LLGRADAANDRRRGFHAAVRTIDKARVSDRALGLARVLLEAGAMMGGAAPPVPMGPVTLAILCMGLAALMSSALHVGVRALADSGMPSAQIVFLRTLITIFLTAPFVFRPGKMAWRTAVPHLHIVRGAIGTVSMWLWYHALSSMPLADAATLGQTTAFFLVLGAAVYFREHVGIVRWTALGLGILGALVVLRPGRNAFQLAALAALASSVLWATSLLMSKALSRHDSVITITFYQPMTIAPWAFLFAWPTWVPTSGESLTLLTAMSVAAAISNYCMVKALSLADASITAPIDYTKLLWTTLAGFFLFGEVPGLTTWIGAALIVSGSLLIVWHERINRVTQRP
jgi:drug/metabolite transporter (DMT)-like permease